MAIISLLDLTEADSLSGSEIFPVSQNGTTKRTTISAIGGGIGSVTEGIQAAVLAGSNNRVLSSFGVVVQGNNNYTAGTIHNTILNGKDNCNLSIGYGTIINGNNNLIAGCRAYTERSIILNGYQNSLSAGRMSIIGGNCNVIDATGPGRNNAILVGRGAKIIGTTNYQVCNNVVLAGGGQIQDSCNSIIGNQVGPGVIRKSNLALMGVTGFSCILSSNCSFIGAGGFLKIESGCANSILNGSNNTILSGSRGSILGGQYNSLTGNNSFIIGSGINGFADNTTFVNKLSATNSIHAGNGFTGTVTISSNEGDKSMVITDGIITGIS